MCIKEALIYEEYCRMGALPPFPFQSVHCYSPKVALLEVQGGGASPKIN